MIPFELRKKIFTRDNFLCTECKTPGKYLEVHHIVERKHGGDDREENLLTLCEDCHSLRHPNIHAKGFWKVKYNRQFGRDFNQFYYRRA